jgi:cysteine synthase A
VIEATSGNTGIGLAMVCAQKGYPLVVTMAESFSVERRKLLRFLGAKVVLTPAAEKGTGMLAKAVELAAKNGWFLCRQFENPANAEVHTRTTAREILADFDGEALDYWVSGFGTGGTLLGVARELKRVRPGIRIVAAEPDNSPLLGSGVRQPRGAHGASESHPRFRPHLMQGWAPDFISQLTESALDAGLIDEIVPVAGADALRLSRELARQEGIFVGTSSGATLAAALDVARRAPLGATIVCMLPDTGERYLSTPLFENIGEEMTAEEWEVSRSTPLRRFDAPSAPTPAPAAPEPKVAVDPAAARFVTEALDKEPVVMFALEWCEFCWSVRKLFTKLGIAYRSVDVDSVEFQKEDLGGRIRGVLADRTGAKTLPQVFVGGEHIGGATDTFDAWRNGTLQARLDKKGVSYDRESKLDPYSLLPKWLQPRKQA